MESILSRVSIKRPASSAASEGSSQYLRQINDLTSVLPLRLLHVTQSHAQVIETEGLPLEARPKHYTIISHVWGKKLVTLSGFPAELICNRNHLARRDRRGRIGQG
jgi:hypothetical protein